MFKHFDKTITKLRKIEPMGCVQLGVPSEITPVNIKCTLSGADTLGYVMFVSYENDCWNIDYTTQKHMFVRNKMKHIGGLRSDKDMYDRVKLCIDIIKRENS